MKLSIVLLFICTITALISYTTAAGQAHAICRYSHTLNDDSILFPESEGKSMFHDFFGNVVSNGMSTIDSIYAHPDNNCDIHTDGSSYWIPSWRMGDKLYRPTYQKTYYQAANALKYPVIQMPRGLQLIAGNPLNTGYTGNVWYVCGDQSGVPKTECKPESGSDISQYNLNILFPNCWDGFNIRPNFTYKNAVYSSDNGECPPSHPKRIPQLNMNVAYFFKGITNFTDAVLSLNPKFYENGTVDWPWTSLFSAHADFFNGWDEDALKFMTDECLNKEITCGNDMPRAYNRPTSIHVMAGGDKISDGAVFQVSSTNVPFIKLTIPDKAFNSKWSAVYLQLYAKNNNASGDSYHIWVNAVTADQFNSATTCAGWTSETAGLYAGPIADYGSINITQKAMAAVAAKQTNLYFCLYPADGQTFSFDSLQGENKPRLLFLDPGTKVGNDEKDITPYPYVIPTKKPIGGSSSDDGLNSATQVVPSLLLVVSLLLALL
eukprot:gene445-531_t